MGIDYCAFNVLLHLLNNNKFKNVLTIGRQQIHCDFLHFKCGEYCENLFTYFGSERVDSVDASNYENCTIIHDINYPMESEIKYDLIFDGGCSEHIFNCQQSYQNYINALEIGGIYLGIIPNNNFSGHGFYQFSPEFFVQIFQKKYNAELLELYLAKVNTPMSEWIKLDNTIRYRNETKFDDTTPVYIIVIAKKCSSDGIQFTEQFPQQHNYIIDWKK
jgi:hypothetical protein